MKEDKSTADSEKEWQNISEEMWWSGFVFMTVVHMLQTPLCSDHPFLPHDVGPKFFYAGN